MQFEENEQIIEKQLMKQESTNIKISRLDLSKIWSIK